jgi:glyoxylase-like metal-dependent hydrolase (beta-lactamase superfamily II)
VSAPASDSASEPELELIDLHHLGVAKVIGTWRVGDVIVDPGPSSCLERLLPVLELHPPRVLALTHIHLDHAGATGSLMQRFPEAEVWVHELGAYHMIDPSRLLRSAGRLYGADMDRLWGEMLPVAADRVRELRGGETLGDFEVAYTPGHASHHVSYLHRPSSVAFTGDVTGVRIDPACMLAPTPPPDIDLRAWRASLELVEAWRPGSLAVTHFGRYEDVEQHIGALREQLDWVQRLVEDEDQDEASFAAAIRAMIADASAPDLASAYGQAMPPEQSYQGLARHLRADQPA